MTKRLDTKRLDTKRLDTKRLYYEDPGLVRFQARLLEQEPADPARGGWQVLLDRTAFYPEGGGQPSDRGTLAGVPVSDVQLEGERLLHFVERPLPAAQGAEVEGQVDPGRRLEFRQQHTGQHVVSACLSQVAGTHTLSASLGERFTTVEVDSPDLTEEQLREAEELANRIVCRNLPVRVSWLDREQALRLPLRKSPPAGIDPLRIVEVEALDASACGGLHVASTGEVGLIKLEGTERIRGRLRLYWLIGRRAYRDTREKDALAAALGRELSCAIEQLPSALQELKGRLKAREAALKQLERRLAAATAAALWAQAEPLPGGCRLVLASLPEESPSLLQRLFQELLAQQATVVCLGSSAAAEASWWVGHSEDLSLHLERVLPALLQTAGGRGGGRGGRWQGRADGPEALERLLRQAAEALRGQCAEGPAGAAEASGAEGAGS